MINRNAFARANGRIGAVLLAGLLLAGGGAPAAATQIERVVSAGGIEAWVVHERSPLIALEFAMPGGSDQDPPDKAGVAYLATSAWDDGAGDLDSKAFHSKLEDGSIELGFSAGQDHVRGSLRTLSANRDEAFSYLRLALTAPRFDPDAVERDRDQLIARLKRQSTSPNDIASRTWWATAFPNHPYGRPTTGTPDSIARISIDDLKSYTHRVLARGKLKVAIVGDIDTADVGPLLDRTFGDLPAEPELTPVADVTMQGLGRRIVVPLDVPQAVVTFGTIGISRRDPDFMAAYIVNYILGGGAFSSRLYQEVREKRGLAYGISDSLTWFDHAAVLIGGTATRSAVTGEAIDIIQKEVHRLAEAGPSEKEVADAKSYLEGSYALGLDTSGKVARQLVQIQLDGLGIDYIDRRSSLIEAVTLEDTKRVAKRLLDAGLLVTVAGKPQGLTSTE
ncbi:MAG TPA: pitrilysin family protein [Xanthobacteraceae bacterium]|nr:pitrilysin family protein [Xanthobacteraceae bacterium]